MDRHLIDSNSRIVDALDALNRLSGGVMTLLVTDGDDGPMAGTVTDGDIRRALLRGVPLDAPVTHAMKRDFRYLREHDDNAVATLRELRAMGIRLVPVLDASGHISRIIDTTITTTLLPVGAILMAGGKGERLRPLTIDTPKPLLHVGGRPIIDHNISALAAAGVSDISVTVNYLAEKIEAHFSAPSAGVKVKCVREDRPLGTMGAAALCELPPMGETIVMNSDLLTDISFEEMYLHHKSHKADITGAAIPYTVSVPYAILETDGELVRSLEEKPSYSYYANAGIYIISNRLLRSLPTDRRTDATDLMSDTIAAGGRVTYFPLAGTWIDIGSPADYERACRLMM